MFFSFTKRSDVQCGIVGWAYHRLDLCHDMCICRELYWVADFKYDGGRTRLLLKDRLLFQMNSRPRPQKVQVHTYVESPHDNALRYPLE